MDSKQRLVRGWGINDADYVTKRCPIYHCWVSMVARCHSPKTQARQKTYVGCWIDERWKYFMIFRAWYLDQAPRPDEQLDKDFLGDGKLYSRDTCCFVTRLFNSLFTDSGTSRGKWPQGVSKYKWKFLVRMRCKGVLVYLGYFDTPEEASDAYLKAKAAYVEDLLVEFPQPPRLEAAIRQKMVELIQQEHNLLEETKHEEK